MSNWLNEKKTMFTTERNGAKNSHPSNVNNEGFGGLPWWVVIRNYACVTEYVCPKQGVWIKGLTLILGSHKSMI